LSDDDFRQAYDTAREKLRGEPVIGLRTPSSLDVCAELLHATGARVGLAAVRRTAQRLRVCLADSDLPVLS
jgi:hypothetical protein